MSVSSDGTLVDGLGTGGTLFGRLSSSALSCRHGILREANEYCPLAPVAAGAISLPVYFYLDNPVNLDYKGVMRPKFYTTREVAKRAGVSRQTLQGWIAAKKIKAPGVIQAVGLRLWAHADLMRVLKVKSRKYPRKVRPN